MRKILTLLAVCCRCGVWFPLWMFMLSLCPDCPTLPAMGLLFGTGVCAALWKRFCERRFLHGRTAFLIALLPAMLLCCGCVLCLHLIACRFAVCIPLSVITVFAVMTGAQQQPEELCSATAYAAFLSAVVIAAGAMHYAELPVPMLLLLTVTGVISAVWLLLRNQFMLLRMVNRRSTADTDVPPDILRHNLKMVFAIALAVAALMIFRRPLMQVLIWMQDAARDLVSAVFSLLARFVEWLDSGEIELPEIDETDYSPKFKRGTMNPLWLLMWIPFIAVAVIVWKNFLSDWYYDLRDFLRAFIKRMRTRRAPAGAAPEIIQADFYDTETDVRRLPSAKQEKREWRRKLRAWMRLPDSREKFYAGYVLLTEAPAWADTKLRASDTVREIQQKWAEAHTPANALDAVTAAYHANRYAEKELPPDAVAKLTETLRHLK